MLVSLVLSLLLSSSAHAEEPTTTVPATVTVAPQVNRPGLLQNKAASVVTFDKRGCPGTYDTSPQLRTPEGVATVMDAATDASTRCVIARAEAEAIRDSAEANRLDAEGRRGATLMLASAGADVARGADGRGAPVYLDAHNGVVATGDAAFVAAAGNESFGGVSPLNNYSYNKAAWDLTRPPVQQQVAPPPATDPQSATVTSKPKPAATVEDAEARAARILGK